MEATKAVKDSSAIAMGVGKGESTTSKASFMVLGMTQATADTEYHANHMGLKHWQNLRPCDFCPADAIEGSDDNFSDFGPDSNSSGGGVGSGGSGGASGPAKVITGDRGRKWTSKAFGIAGGC